MNKRWIFLILTLFQAVSSGLAQISIEECYEKARANYPLIRQYGLIERSRDYSLSNAGKSWLPQVQLSAKASYQSDVTEIPLDLSRLGIPGVSIPSLSKDQYGATLEISQNVWDGGAVGAKRRSILAKSESDEKELEVNLYAVREQVNRLFFGILLSDAMAEQNRLFQDELQRNYDRVSALMQNGLASQADLDAVKVEQLKAVQSLTQIIYGRKAYLDMLSAFVGEEIGEDASLVKPAAGLPLPDGVSRPELAMFDALAAGVDAARDEVNASLSPRLGLFLTGGYGKPGLNMLKSDLSAYYIGGLRLTWNFGAFYTRKNSLNLLESSRHAIRVQRETFLFNTSLNRTGRESEIDKYRELLRSDDEIIALRNSVRRASEARLENGTLTAIDLMRDMSVEQMARQDKILHEIEMLQAVYNLKFITNN
ncbi:MAG: TolC family protein [Prevotellaceae bacterium]|jgi:outer membrane protein TolC|nr:TolC family protein [Prevotellaceae bacterium]